MKREGFVVLERRDAVEAEARDAHDGKLDGQHIPFLPRRKVSWRAVHRADGRIGKGLGVKPRRVLGAAIVPKANRVLWWIHHGRFSIVMGQPKGVGSADDSASIGRNIRTSPHQSDAAS